MEKIASVKFISYEESIPSALEKIGAGKVLSEQSKIILKPNLTCNRRPPLTTGLSIIPFTTSVSASFLIWQ